MTSIAGSYTYRLDYPYHWCILLTQRVKIMLREKYDPADHDGDDIYMRA
jgi:hypothetical protein